MINYEIQQKSEAWHLLRVGKVGGSTSHQLHIKSDTLLEQLLGEICEPFFYEESFVSDAMQRGNDLEPLAIESVGEYVGKQFKTCGWIQSDECQLIGASPDGITEDENTIVEVKCPTAKVHIGYIRAGVIPTDYIDQVCHYFAVLPTLQTVHFASFRPECIKPLFVVTVTPDTEVNVGTKARPVITTVREYAKIKVELAKALETQLTNEHQKITF